MPPKKSIYIRALKHMVLSLNHGLEAIKNGNDFTAENRYPDWEMAIIRNKNGAHLSIKCADPTLTIQLYKHFIETPKQAYDCRLSQNGHHMVITAI